MRAYKALVVESRDTAELGGLLEVYEELAAAKMQKIREATLKSREFYDGLTKLMDEVGSDVSQVVKNNKKIAAVFMAASSGFYGDIVEKTFYLFLDFIKHNPSDIYVIGRSGNKLMKEHAPGFTWQVIDLPDDTIEEANLKEITAKLLTYKKVQVFYGNFKNIVIQNPVAAEISGQILPKPGEPVEIIRQKRLKYLYEPSVDRISQIFSEEIFLSLFENTLEQANLAKFGSRLIHLDESLEEIKIRLGLLSRERRNVRKKTLDKKQNSMISSILVRK